jgi:uncharacterized RDD family membrane protein YckC
MTTDKISSEVSIETPEQIRLRFKLAGPGTRMMAYLLDLAIRLGATGVIGATIFIFTGWISSVFATGVLMVLMFGMEWGYHTLFEWLWNGSTPGKRTLGIRVVRTNGVAIDLVRSAMRNLLRAADIFPFAYATGLLTIFFLGRGRRLGDLAADTMVVRDDRIRLNDTPAMPENASNLIGGSLTEVRLTDRELALVEEFFRRKHLFSEARTQELAEILAAPIRQTTGINHADSEELVAAVLTIACERRSSWFGQGGKGMTT